MLRYREGEKTWWQPRHPFVAVHDLVLVMMSGALLMFANGVWTQGYFLVTMIMFGVSALHHWLRYQAWHHRLDRAMIHIMVAGTTLPYTELVLVNGGGVWLVVLWGWATVFVIAKSFGRLISQGVLPAVVYTVTGGVAVVVMLPIHTKFEPLFWLACFWVGVVVYSVQQLTYSCRWFDVYPQRFGFREVQHLLLAGAFGLHAIATFI